MNSWPRMTWVNADLHRRWSGHGWRIIGCSLLLTAGTVQAAAPFADSPLAPAVAASFVGGEGDDPTLGNHVANISGGYDALLLRVHLIRPARSSIEIQTFIWSNDESGRLMIYELIEAARRGVPPGHPDFHKNYREVGSFPGTEGMLSTKEILTRIYKAVGMPLTPGL